VAEENDRILASVKRVPVPPIPARVATLLADAIAAETPELRPYEAEQRAREALAQAEAQRTGQSDSAAA
jgi:hypothetical protein